MDKDDEIFDYEELIEDGISEPEEDPEDMYEEEEDDEGYEDYEDYTENESDEENEEEDDEFDEDDDVVMHLRPWMIPAFAGMVVLAILICIPLWKLSHHDQNSQNDKILVAVTETTTEPVPEVTAEPTAEPTQEPQPTPEVQPTETPEVTEAPVVTEEPVATEEPAATDVPYISGDSSMAFETVNESVTAKDVTNLRTSPSTTDNTNVVGKLRNGEVLTRTGQNADTGWSRLEYNGQTVYAVSSYLVTDLAYTTPVVSADPNRVSTQDGRVIVFVDCDDYITPKDTINLRTEPSTSAGNETVRTQVRNGTNLHRTGDSGDAGWSRVEYNGEILYAVTNYVVSGSAPE